MGTIEIQPTLRLRKKLLTTTEEEGKVDDTVDAPYVESTDEQHPLLSANVAGAGQIAEYDMHDQEPCHSLVKNRLPFLLCSSVLGARSTSQLLKPLKSARKKKLQPPYPARSNRRQHCNLKSKPTKASKKRMSFATTEPITHS